MSTATAEPTLPPLHEAFTTALSEGNAKEASEVKEPAIKEPAKQPTKEAVGKEVTKDAKDTTKDAAKEPGKETRKRTALEAALSGESAEVKKEEPDEIEKLLSIEDPQKDNWKAAQEVLKRQSRELKEAREKITKAAEPPPEVMNELKTLREERESLKAENAKYRDSVMALDVRYDPGTQEKIQARDKQATSLADRVAAAGGNKEAFLSALELPLAKRGKAIDTALDGIESSRELTTINAKLSQIELADEQLDELMSKPHKTFEDLKQQREIAAHKHEEQVERFKQATFEKVQRDLPKLSKLMRSVPDDVEGAEEFNATLKADLERAPSLLDVAPEEAATQAFKAARYDSVEKMFVEQSAKDAARIAELEAEVTKYRGAEPGFRGNGKPKATNDWERPIEEVFVGALKSGEPI